MAEKFVDFKLVKERVSIEAVLNHYRVPLRRANQHSLRGRCPLPMHSSDQSTETFSVQTIKNIWACQSTSCVVARHGKVGGNILDFVALMEQVTIREAAEKLRDWFLGASPTAPIAVEKGSTSTQELASKKTSDDSGADVNTPLSFTLKGIDHAHPYLVQRGVTESIAKLFDVGFFGGRGSMSGRMVIPIHNRAGELLAYAGRAIDATEPRYKLPAGFRKSLELFNLHRVIAEKNSRSVIVVEGFFDCLAVSAAGFPCVALMGSVMSAAQEKLLAQNFSSAWLLFDGDDAGRHATGECVARLARSMYVRATELPNNVQPDQLSAKDLQELLASKS